MNVLKLRKTIVATLSNPTDKTPNELADEMLDKLEFEEQFIPWRIQIGAQIFSSLVPSSHIHDFCQISLHQDAIRKSLEWADELIETHYRTSKDKPK